MRYRTIPIFLTFFVMGTVDSMGPLADAVKHDLQISDVKATLLSFAVFIAFAVSSVPGGLLAPRIGKKRLLLLGLGLNCIAVLVPLAVDTQFPAAVGLHLRVGRGYGSVAGCW